MPSQLLFYLCSSTVFGALSRMETIIRKSSHHFFVTHPHLWTIFWTTLRTLYKVRLLISPFSSSLTALHYNELLNSSSLALSLSFTTKKFIGLVQQCRYCRIPLVQTRPCDHSIVVHTTFVWIKIDNRNMVHELEQKRNYPKADQKCTRTDSIYVKLPKVWRATCSSWHSIFLL